MYSCSWPAYIKTVISDLHFYYKNDSALLFCESQDKDVEFDDLSITQVNDIFWTYKVLS